MTKKRLPTHVRKSLESALRRADFKLREGRCSVDPEAQEAMRIYLDTWVAGPLRSILQWDDGDRAYLEWGEGDRSLTRDQYADD